MGAFLFGDKLIMRMTKNWGFVNSKAELYMLAHAEHTRRELKHERKVIQRRLPRVNVTDRR